MAETPYTPPPISNQAPKPPGILPRHAQGLAIGGIALVMVLAIAFSGGKAPKERIAVPPALAVTAPDEARLRDYRARIELQMQKLAAEQARQSAAEHPTSGFMASAPPATGPTSPFPTAPDAGPSAAP